MTVTDRPAGMFVGTEMPTAGWWEALWPAPGRVLEAVGLARGMDVVDLCAGDGWFTLEIARIARHVVAIELDENLLQVARRRLSEHGLRNCDYVAGDAYEIARLVPRPVDFVLLANVFHGVPDHLRLARGVRKVLKSEGSFAIVNWHRRPREETIICGEPRGPRTELRMSPEQTIDVVEPAGFALVQVVELPPYHYGAVFARLPTS